MEPTDLELLTRHGGIYRAFYTYVAEELHSAMPYPEGNVLKKAHRAIGELLKLSEEISRRQTEDVRYRPSLCVTTLHAGNAANLHARYTGMDYTVEVQSDRPTLNVPEGCAMIRTMTKVWEEMMGKPCHYRYVHGGTDASSIINHNQMQMMVCGPSDGKVGVGDPNEYVRIEALL